jgi:hypothetical protein
VWKDIFDAVDGFLMFFLCFLVSRAISPAVKCIQRSTYRQSVVSPVRICNASFMYVPAVLVASKY